MKSSAARRADSSSLRLVRASRPARARHSSAPAAIANGWLDGDEVANSLNVPSVVIRPTLSPWTSTNQSAPSGPAAIATGTLSGVGPSNDVIAPSVVIRPILFACVSSNQSAHLDRS